MTIKLPTAIEAFEVSQSGNHVVERRVIFTKEEYDDFIREFGDKFHVQASQITDEEIRQHQIITQKGEAIDKLIIFYNMPDNREQYHSFYKVAASLGIVPEMAYHAFQSMTTSRQFLDGPLATNNPKVKITSKGQRYAEQLEEAKFQETGLPTFTTFTPMTIKETCELIFQRHKESQSYSIIWTKETFKPNTPKNLIEAKEIMINKRVIFKSSSEKLKTILNDSVHDATSYDEALRIIDEINSPLPTTYNDHSIITYGDKSPVSGRDTVQTIAEVKDEKSKKWLNKILDQFIENIVQYAVTAFFAFITGVGFGKSCSPAHNQGQSQSTYSKDVSKDSSGKIIDTLRIK